MIEALNLAIGNKQFLLIAELISFSCKLYLLIALAFNGLQSSLRKLSSLLIIFLFGALLNDLYYISLLVQHIFFFTQECRPVTFIARIGWAFFITQHQSLGLFLENLNEKKVQFKKLDKVFFIFNIIISTGFLYLAFFKFNVPSDSPETLPFEIKLVQASYIYLLPLLIPIIYRFFINIKVNQLPKILKKQSRIFILFLLIPQLFLEHIANRNSFFASFAKLLPFNWYTILILSTLLCSFAMYYCCKRMLGLRFLNIKNQVEPQGKFNFIDDFKEILEQLSHVTSFTELTHITHTFFKSAFSVPVGKVKLYLRNNSSFELSNDQQNLTCKPEVENFLMNYSNLIQENKIFIKDEIEFTNFYEENLQRSKILEFLESINADIFLPICERQTINAYIIVERDARSRQLFNSNERDQMSVFANYVSNVINILKHSKLELVLKKEKELQEELYHKHQEISQYKESIKSFLRNNSERKIGIIFYKSRKFTFANQAAQDLIGIDLNTNQGHPLAQSLKHICRKAQEYKTSQITVARDNNNNRLMLSAYPSLEPNEVIITVYYPEISDIIKSHFDQLKDPSKWDYLLYLETTQSGQLIHQLIPGTSESLLSFKIDLLASALSKKATLLQMPEDDLIPTVELLHHISLRKNLHVIKLTIPEKNDEVAIKLFGINPLLDKSEQTESLLQKLDNTGTLCIQNIDFLSMETQNYLAEFITYGFFHKFKSDHKLFSNVRIICTTHKNLDNLVKEGLFSKSLFNELRKTSLLMPSLMTLPETEINQLAQGFTEQALKTQTFKNLLELSDKDKSKLFDQRALSLQELKSKVQQLLIQKSTKHKIYDQTSFDEAYHVSDPELAQAIRLGKKALKDPHVMSMLWDKFKNQNKIATLLGVNRSSVNRRCQEYKLYEK